LRAGTLNNAFIQALNWGNITTSLSAVFIAFKAMADSYINPCTQEIYVSDNPRWHEAMNSPEIAGYWEAMKVEIAILVKLKAWTLVPLSPDMNVLDSTWAFKY